MMLLSFATAEGSSNPLEGLRVLLVEDDYMIATRLARLLADLGCEVVGPAPSVDEGVRLAAHARVDAGVLDVNIMGGNSGPVAEALQARGTPFVFVTGYSSPHHLPPALLGARRLSKPVAETTLRDALIREISG